MSKYALSSALSKLLKLLSIVILLWGVYLTFTGFFGTFKGHNPYLPEEKDIYAPIKSISGILLIATGGGRYSL